MKKFKKIASLALTAAMLTSAVPLAVSANAVINADKAVSANVGTQAKVQDGVILHAFNWSYNSIKENLPAIAAAGYSTVQTSPVQQPKDYGSSRDVEGQWWKLYQPVSMAVAEESWLGTKDELSQLCAEADKYGIKIICDIVSNHMGNAVETSPNSISDQVKKYQPDFYQNQSTYFRSNSINVSDSSVKNVVQGHLSNCPDLATDNPNVQAAVISLLKECIDCGVDGFRFDAAKHIETPDDGTYGSDYWPNITSAAGEYYKSKTGAELYIYGEILNNCGAGRKYSSYTNYINVTDNRTGDAVLANVHNGKANTASAKAYKSGVSASDVVLWAESHDTYMGDSGSGGLSNTSSVPDSEVVKAWAIVAARQDATALYFARPGTAMMGDAAGDNTYKSTAVSEINKFHNLFVGQTENLGSSDNIAYVARGTSGIVLANCGGNEKSVSIADTGIADGIYTDTITGNKFTVSSGVLKGSIGSTGVAVVYNGSTTPRNTVSVENGSFMGETMTVELGLDNATSGTYSLDGTTAYSYNKPVTIRIGSDYNYGETINLTVTATDGKTTTSATYKYTKNEAADSGVYLWMNAANREKYNWKAPYYVYIYDEDTTEGTTYSNASWPGQKMELDTKTGYYYIQVSSKTCLINGVEGNYDLANSPNTRVIYNDGSSQYPSDTASAATKQKFSVGGKSKIFAQTSASSFAETDLVPAGSGSIEATNVVRPSTDRKYGDTNNDGIVSIDDVTLLQKVIVDLAVMPEAEKPIWDVNADGEISIDDATCIQKEVADMEHNSLAGKPYTGNSQATTSPQPATKPQPATTKPQPSTKPQETTAPPVAKDYTLYFKTTLGWMENDGCSLYAYDTASGESYQFSKTSDEYPNVYSTVVPKSTTEVIVYRALGPVDSKPVADSANGPAYQAWTVSVSVDKDCIRLDNDEKTTTTEKYYYEEAPEFVLDRVYYDNSKSKWSEVYVYGWAESGLNNKAIIMDQIPGTNIWYFDFDEPLMPGSACFLFKNTSATWDKQSPNITVVDGKNCYIGSASNKGAGTWSTYSE